MRNGSRGRKVIQ